MFQTSVQKTSRRIRRTTLQPLATAYDQQPAIISALASCVALMTPAPRSSCNYQVVGGTSIIFAICYPDQCRITKQGKLIYRAAQRMQEPKAANSLRWGRCCKSNPLLPPSTLSPKPFTLSVVLTSLQLWNHSCWLYKTNWKNGNSMKFLSSKILIPMQHAISHGKRCLVWHCREIHWPPDAPELQPTNPSEASRWAQTLQSDAYTW